MTAHAALFVTTVAVTLEAFLTPLADRLRADGWRVDALANGVGEREALSAHFDNLHEACWNRNPLHPRNLKMVAPLRNLVASGHFDVVHVHTPIAALVTRFALRESDSVRVIYTAHGFHFIKGGNPVTNAIFRSIESMAAPWTDYLVTMNAADFQAAQGFRGLDATRVRYIPGVGVDTERYRPDDTARQRLMDELKIPPGSFIVAMVAEFTKNKRHAMALEAFALLENAHAHLVLVGSGPTLEATRAHAQRLDVAHRVHFLGQRSDVPSIIAASDVLMLLSAREGLPRVVLEALSVGIPVIGTPTRGIVDAVDESDGWIAEPTPQAVAQTLRFAASDADERARRGAAGRLRVQDRYALDRIVDAYRSLYDEAVS